jgi:hypothetical protein
MKREMFLVCKVVHEDAIESRWSSGKGEGCGIYCGWRLIDKELTNALAPFAAGQRGRHRFFTILPLTLHFSSQTTPPEPAASTAKPIGAAGRRVRCSTPCPLSLSQSQDAVIQTTVGWESCRATSKHIEAAARRDSMQ